jgi:hypothetical protein
MWTNPPDDEIRTLLESTRHIIVVGLSPKPWRDSHRVALYLMQHGYAITGVNPGHAGILGRPCHPSVAAIPAGHPVEIVNVFRRGEYVDPHVDEAIARGARAVWLQIGVMNEGAARRARDAGLVVVMDRCIKVEHARYAGRMHWLGFNTHRITSLRGGLQ